MVLLTLYGEARAHLASKNYGNHVVFQVSLNFWLFVLLRKTVVNTHKTVDNKAPEQILLYSNNTLFRNKAANSGDLRAAQPNCSENRFVEKNKSISHMLFWNSACDDLSHLPLGSPPCGIIIIM